MRHMLQSTIATEFDVQSTIMRFWSCRYQTPNHEDTGGNCSNNASLPVLAGAATQSYHLWLGGPQLMASVTSCHHTIGTMGCVCSNMNWPQEARLGVPATCQHVIQSIGLPEQGLLGVWEAAEVIHLFTTDTKPFQTISLVLLGKCV